MSLPKLSRMRQMIQEVLKIPVDLIAMAGIGEDFWKEQAGTEILVYEE